MFAIGLKRKALFGIVIARQQRCWCTTEGFFGFTNNHLLEFRVVEPDTATIPHHKLRVGFIDRPAEFSRTANGHRALTFATANAARRCLSKVGFECTGALQPGFEVSNAVCPGRTRSQAARCQQYERDLFKMHAVTRHQHG